MSYNVAVLGASSNPERYSYRAVVKLTEAGHTVYPIHPSEKNVAGLRCYPSLAAVPVPLDTISVYLSEKNSTPIIGDIVESNARRVILNPGAENERLRSRCEAAGIIVEEACTLVLLTTGQFSTGGVDSRYDM